MAEIKDKFTIVLADEVGYVQMYRGHSTFFCSDCTYIVIILRHTRYHTHIVHISSEY